MFSQNIYSAWSEISAGVHITLEEQSVEGHTTAVHMLNILASETPTAQWWYHISLHLRMYSSSHLAVI